MTIYDDLFWLLLYYKNIFFIPCERRHVQEVVQIKQSNQTSLFIEQLCFHKSLKLILLVKSYMAHNTTGIDHELFTKATIQYL